MTVDEEKETGTLPTETVTIITERVQGQPKTKYAWIVLGAAFLTHFLNPSLNYAAGVFHVAFMERFQSDITLTAWVGAVYSSMFALAGPVASLVTNMFDCRTCVFLSGILGLVGYGMSAFVGDLRQLFLTYALIAGLGQAFAQVAAVVVLGHYFPHDTAIASGIVVSGTGLGIFVHPPLVQLLVDWYGLPGALLLCGAMVSHCCILGLLMRPAQNEIARKNRIRSGRTTSEAILVAVFGGSLKNKDMFLDFSFWMFLISTLLFAMGYSLNIMFLPDYMKHIHQASSQEASLVISFIGIGSIVSRLCVGTLGNDKRVGPEIAYFSIVGVTAIISAFISVFTKETGSRLAYGLLLGLYTGGVFPLESAIALKMSGIENFAIAFGAVMFFLGFGYLIGSPIAGAIYETTGNYDYVFLSSTIIFSTSSICGFLSALKRKSRNVTEDVPEGGHDAKSDTIPEMEPLSNSQMT